MHITQLSVTLLVIGLMTGCSTTRIHDNQVNTTPPQVVVVTEQSGVPVHGTHHPRVQQSSGYYPAGASSVRVIGQPPQVFPGAHSPGYGYRGPQYPEIEFVPNLEYQGGTGPGYNFKYNQYCYWDNGFRRCGGTRPYWYDNNRGRRGFYRGNRGGYYQGGFYGGVRYGW